MEVSAEISAALDRVLPLLRATGESDDEVARESSRWSRKDMLGHLIDSAANNHQRIVRAAYGSASSFPPYDQNAWVRVQAWNEVAWDELVQFWEMYNRHLSRIILCLPAEALASPCDIGKPEQVELASVLRDYVRHLDHHLERLVG